MSFTACGPERSSSTMRYRFGSDSAANVAITRYICSSEHMPVKEYSATRSNPLQDLLGSRGERAFHLEHDDVATERVVDDQLDQLLVDRAPERRVFVARERHAIGLLDGHEDDQIERLHGVAYALGD